MNNIPSIEFRKFPKIPRLSRDIIITEKIDGTNACIYIPETMEYVLAGSRNRWLTLEADNFGFCRWVCDHAEELKQLGPGYHYGEWWGGGIQRGYGLKEKRFSLFNVTRWTTKEEPPACCNVVPIILSGGVFSDNEIDIAMTILKDCGSYAATGYMNPEGIVIYHVAGNVLFKKTFEGDDKGKEYGV